jgi:hypothetical protein
VMDAKEILKRLSPLFFGTHVRTPSAVFQTPLPIVATQ